MAMPKQLKRVNPDWLHYWRIAHSDPHAYTRLYGASLVNRTPSPLITIEVTPELASLLEGLE